MDRIRFDGQFLLPLATTTNLTEDEVLQVDCYDCKMEVYWQVYKEGEGTGC